MTIDNSIEQYGPVRCGKSGVAIMYKKTLSYCIERVENIFNDRIIAIEVKCIDSLPLFMFCVYLPACNDLELYQSVLNDLESLT